jgi:hypothetical protein
MKTRLRTKCKACGCWNRIEEPPRNRKVNKNKTVILHQPSKL